jgi:hypothetical protein
VFESPFIHAAIHPIGTLDLRVSLLCLRIEILSLFIHATIHPIGALAVIFLGSSVKILCFLVHAAKVSEFTASIVLFS